MVVKMSNVIKFPPVERVKDITDEENDRLDKIDDYCTDVMTKVFEQLFLDGYNVSHEDHQEAVAMMFESFRAMLYEMHEFYHPMQDVAKMMFNGYDYEE